jgi:hypothetical protein
VSSELEAGLLADLHPEVQDEFRALAEQLRAELATELRKAAGDLGLRYHWMCGLRFDSLGVEGPTRPKEIHG